MTVDYGQMRRVLTAVFCSLIAWCGNQCTQAYRIAPGHSLPEKLLHLQTGFRYAWRNLLPSFHPADLLVGVLCGGIAWLFLYRRRKAREKLLTHDEHGSARWGTKKDIVPFMDSAFENNIILTATERLSMSSRPKDPKNARNKNVLIIGGSGSGKTRFWLKPSAPLRAA